MKGEEEPSQSNSQRLPDTCPISQGDLSQPHFSYSQCSQKPWGRLYPTKPGVLSLGKLRYNISIFTKYLLIIEFFTVSILALNNKKN